MDEISNIQWLGHASFFFTRQNGQTIYYVDAFQLHQSNLPKADLIFVTHTHPDHLSPQDILIISNEDSIVVAPENCLEKLAIPDRQKFPIEPHKSYTVKNFSFQTIPAYNTHPERLQFHPRSNNWVGYIFEVNGKKIFHAGDSDFTPEMAALKGEHLDYALLPMGGMYCMAVEETIEASNTIAAKITIPMHYKGLLREKSLEAEEKLKAGVINSKVVILQELQ